MPGPPEPFGRPYSLENVQIPSSREVTQAAEEPDMHQTFGKNFTQKLSRKRTRPVEDRENLISTLPPKVKYVGNYRKFAKQLRPASGVPTFSGGNNNNNIIISL